MSGLYTFLLLSILYHHGLLGSATTTRVSTRQGYVRGKLEMVVNYKGEQKFLFNFLGIPYAQKPIGNFRFKRPQRLSDPRPTDYNATFHRPVCLQSAKNNNGYIASIQHVWRGANGTRFKASTDMAEDCLYLNIYTPNTICLRKYPVLVYIHGGGYVTGTPIRNISPSDYLPTWHDVVLVTIQYRLGAFGFFTTGDQEAPGNLGLLDQIEALKWIQDNIGAFCGDKNSVTLLGESSGGSSVSLHYLSPLSKGLFHRGIAVSGVSLTPFTVKSKSIVLKASKTLITGLDCEKPNSQLTVQCLRNKSKKAIVEKNTDGFNMQPVVDNYFLPDEPRKLLKKGTFQKHLPLMSGFVGDEGTLGFRNKPDIKDISDFHNYLGKMFFPIYLQLRKEQSVAAYNALAFQYTPWGDLGNPEAFLKSVIDMQGDYLVVAPTHAVLSFHSSQGAPTYMFEFAHRSLHHAGEIWKGVEHGDTTAYKFGLPLLRSPKTNLKFDDDDRSVSKTMVTLFTNFAKTGNPNTPSPVSGVQWTAFNTSNQAYLKIKTKPVMTSKYHPLRMQFWNSYFPTLSPCAWYGHCKRSKAPRPSQPRVLW